MPLTFGEAPWYENPSHPLNRAGEGLGLFLQLKERREAERDRERREALSRFFSLAQKMPEVAARAGPGIVAKYGKDVPELAGMVDWLSNQAEVRAKMQQAGTRWLSGAERLSQEHQASLGRKAMLSMPASPFGAPNVAALGSLMQEAQVHPDTFLQRSAEALSPLERQAAQIWSAEQGGIEPPQPQYQKRFDPNVDLPQDLRAVREAERGGLGPETSEAARIKANLKEGARQRLSRELDAARGERAERQASLTERSLDLRGRQLNLSERQQAIRERTGGSGSYKETRGLLKETLSAETARLAAQQKAWDEELRKRNDGKTPTGAKRERLEAELSGELGARPEKPEAMLPGHMNRLSRKILEEVSTVEEAEAATTAAVDWYIRLVTEKRLSPQEAIAIVLGEAEEPPPDLRSLP